MGNLLRNPKRAEQAAEMAKAIAYPMRLRIVAILCEGDQRVNSLVERLGTAQATVSHHLRIPRMCGLVTTIRTGGESRYTLAEPRIRDLVPCLEGFSFSVSRWGAIDQ